MFFEKSILRECIQTQITLPATHFS